MGGGFIKKRKKAFTLIELLAIIVILAIIAVITVPIILNIIENSKKGAATDSAYGYKDSVNKWYVSELSKPNNENFNLASSYTITDGKLNGTIEIPVSGDKPSSGYLDYSNNVLTGGCLVFGDYAVTFKSDGSVDKTEKGDCSSSNNSENGTSSGNSVPTMAEMCPNCKFSRHYVDQYFNADLEEDLEQYTSYSSMNKNYFTGYILNNSNEVYRAFVCGIEQGEPFCLEGGDPSKYSSNIDILNNFFDEELECGMQEYDWGDDDAGEYYQCEGSSVGVNIYPNNNTVEIYPITKDDVCTVDLSDDDYRVYCGT